MSIMTRGLRPRLDWSCWVSACEAHRKAWGRQVGGVGEIEVDMLERGLLEAWKQEERQERNKDWGTCEHRGWPRIWGSLEYV